MAAPVPARPDPQIRAAAARALGQLLEGNRRFVAGHPLPHVVTPAAREALVAGQHPVAVLLGCVDSRVPPEVVLDQGVDALLTVRTAGQSLAGVAVGSIEFGVRVLGLPLVVVMGHTGCGAVLAALSGNHPEGRLGDLTGEVASRLTEVVGDDPVRATGANLAGTVDALRSLGTLVTPDGHPAHVVGLLYDLGTGQVEVTDDDGLLDRGGSSSTSSGAGRRPPEEGPTSQSG
jgi:carbonic anhydrase